MPIIYPRANPNQRKHFWGMYNTATSGKPKEISLLSNNNCLIITLFVLIIMLMITNVFVILQLSRLNNDIIKPLENASSIIKDIAKTALPWLNTSIGQARSLINILPFVVSKSYDTLTSVGTVVKGYLPYFWR